MYSDFEDLERKGSGSLARPSSYNFAEVQVDVYVRVEKSSADSLEQAGLLAYFTGRYDVAEQMLIQAIRLSEEQADRSAIGQLWSDLAWLYHESGRGGEADSLLRRALEVDLEAFGPETPPVAHRTEELGRLYHATGRYREAGPLLDRALFLYERDPKRHSREIALAQNQIGLNHWAMGDLLRAELFIKRALAGLEAGGVAVRRFWAAAMLDLAELYHGVGRHPEAREAFDLALREADEITRSTGLPNGVCSLFAFGSDPANGCHSGSGADPRSLAVSGASPTLAA